MIVMFINYSFRCDRCQIVDSVFKNGCWSIVQKAYKSKLVRKILTFVPKLIFRCAYYFEFLHIYVSNIGHHPESCRLYGRGFTKGMAFQY